ncbi:MAG TPA: thioredoxin family protein, partial [Bacteroidales bacterium]|nr:thioredoxin family protein [Bacteroidales bacterium]
TYLADAIDALLENRKPSITETKAIGCSIKLKK